MGITLPDIHDIKYNHGYQNENGTLDTLVLLKVVSSMGTSYTSFLGGVAENKFTTNCNHDQLLASQNILQ